MTACSSGGTKTASSPAPSPAPTTSITIKSFMFSPNPATAKVGDTITVKNDDGTDHTLTANDNSFDTMRFSSGSKTITVMKAGTVAIHCDVHNFMTGVIQVAAS
jgi:plastocyanin